MFNTGKYTGASSSQQSSSTHQHHNLYNQQEMGVYYQQPIPYYEQPTKQHVSSNNQGNWYNQQPTTGQRNQPQPYPATNQPFLWKNSQPQYAEKDARKAPQEVFAQNTSKPVQQHSKYVEPQKAVHWDKKELNSYGKNQLEHSHHKLSLKREQ